MSVADDDTETGFSENAIHYAHKTFIRDCPNGRCSKRKFLTFMRQASLEKPNQSKQSLLKTLQNYRQSKKFFSMMFDVYDRNHDGELDFDEYLYALSAITGANRLRTIETLFTFFDVHNQGYITREEFNSRKKLAARFLGQSKAGIKDHRLYEQAFNSMDIDQNERITREEFIQWHLNNHSKLEETKPLRRRTRLLRNLSTLVDIRGQIKTSSLQKDDKNLVDVWLETSMNITPNSELSSTTHADRYLLKIFRRARNRFHHGKNKRNDNQSDSGAFTSSSIRTFTETDCDSDSLADIDEHDFQAISTDDTDSESLCESLEAVLMETLLELRQHRKQHKVNSIHIDTSIQEDSQSSFQSNDQALYNQCYEILPRTKPSYILR